MIMKQRMSCAVSAIMLVSIAAADINEWTSQDQGTDWDLNVSNEIVILNSGIFKFESVSAGGELEDIVGIRIDDSVTGTVTLTIERSTDNNTPGARHVGSIDLTNSNATPVVGDLAELRIDGNLATTGPVVVHHIGGVVSVVGTVQDSITVNGDLSGDITATATEAVTVNGAFPSEGSIIAPMIGDVSVQGIAGDITGTTSIGDITIGNGTNVACSITCIGGTIGIIDITGSHNGVISGDEIGSVIISNALAGSIEADALGDVDVQGTVSNSGGNITVNGPYSGTITISNGATGAYRFLGTFTGEFNAQKSLTGSIEIGTVTPSLSRDLAVPGRIIVAHNAGNADNPVIHIHGSISGTGASAPPISIGAAPAGGVGLNGVIAVDGALGNVYAGGHEIVVTGTRGSAGAIAINYDGASDVDDEWVSGASVSINSQSDSGNDPAHYVWNVRRCRGDFDGDRNVNGDDATPFSGFQSDPETYASTYPGLEGSAPIHGDGDFDGVWEPSEDAERITNLNASGCACVYEEPASNCPGDPNDDFEVSIDDLTILLSHFGEPSGQGPEDGDTNSDGDVDLGDLAVLLSLFGSDLCPSTCGGAPATASVTTTISGFDTAYYSSGEFKGEVNHFVFDVLVTINTSADDWVASGVQATTANGSTFRIVPDAGNPPVPGSSLPDKYATFFSVPYSVNASSRFTTPFPTGGIAGEYDPGTSAYTYTTSAIDAAWYDMNSTSNDGPAAVLRIVLDVNGVTGADTSAGFGSVYFTTGSPGSGDIKVADMTFEVEHKYDDSGSTTVSGSFYVTD